MNMLFYLSLTRSTDQSNSEILFTLKLIELHRGPLGNGLREGVLIFYCGVVSKNECF